MSAPSYRDVHYVVALSSTFMLIACDGEQPWAPVEPLPSPEVASITVHPPTVILVAIDERLRLVATARDASEQRIQGKVFTWSSSNDAVVSVTDSGVVTAVSDGVAMITVTTNGLKGIAFAAVTQIGVRLAFVVPPPTNVYAAKVIHPGIEVEIRDALGSVVANATKPVTLALGENARGATLSGTTALNAVGGVAAFDDLAIDRAGRGYTLVASSEDVVNETSSPFDVLSDIPAAPADSL